MCGKQHAHDTVSSGASHSNARAASDHAKRAGVCHLHAIGTHTLERICALLLRVGSKQQRGGGVLLLGQRTFAAQNIGVCLLLRRNPVTSIEKAKSFS